MGLMTRYQQAVSNLHSAMIYNDVESLIAEALTKAHASPMSNNEFMCEYLEQAYQDILSGKSDYPTVWKP